MVLVVGAAAAAAAGRSEETDAALAPGRSVKSDGKEKSHASLLLLISTYI